MLNGLNWFWRIAVACLWIGECKAAPWKFAVLSDCRGVQTGTQGSTNGVRASVLGPMASAMAADGVDLVIFPGDLVNGDRKYGTLEQQLRTWKVTMAPLYQNHVEVYPCRGNHDTAQDRPPGKAVEVWRSAFPELPRNGPAEQDSLTYYVNHENACFIGFDQYAGRVKNLHGGKGQTVTYSGLIPSWVTRRIKDSQQQWVFVFGHAAGFIGHHQDSLGDVPTERDRMWDALAERGGLYFCGHDHMYIRRTEAARSGRDVMELIVGCGGAPHYSYDNAHLNAHFDRHVVPVDLFVNAALPKDHGNKNTGGHPAYFGYVLITIDGAQLTGEWKAFVNYDYKHWAAPAAPEFKTLDSFNLRLPNP